jgi:hypothetical protein
MSRSLLKKEGSFQVIRNNTQEVRMNCSNNVKRMCKEISWRYSLKKREDIWYKSMKQYLKGGGASR